MNKIKMLTFQDLGDERGELVVVEGNRNIPFDIKRIFYIFKTTEGTVRGKHANRNSKFVFINVKGSCRIDIDTGNEKRTVLLDKPHEGVYIDNMVWKEMYDFSEDSILIVITNEYYDEKEYIRDYEQFINEVRKG
ncbi:MAG: TDP-4-oxo-6-deoxy-alpha-D-glucose-3,4-oxoisomerase [bacterium ADurb.Bin363]|nr:MAG: TDP-4-oxo-6-deoxy-alpha-D-glucose-3,4-oxoisomerase [bacterium ADurb.Bin363]